jgi:hypothetical protein
MPSNLFPDLQALSVRLGSGPTRTQLRRNSAAITEIFLSGISINTIAGYLERERVFVEDAIRWESNKRKRGERG